MKKFRSEIRKIVCEFTKEYLVDVAHDIHHLDRVCNNALYLNKLENNAKDEALIILASYLHDFHRLYTNKNGDDKLKKVEESNDLIIHFFNIYRQYDNLRDSVIELISSTDKYSFSDNDKKEADELPMISKILFDADNLDALGAVGIARAFSFGQWINEPLYDSNYPLVDSKYSHKEKTHSVLHHFYEKLFKLEKEFYTETAKDIAKSRTDFTRNYIEQFLVEYEICMELAV